MTVSDAMIVAGGRGTRLRPLTFTTPKPLVPFCGRPFLAGVIARLAAAGIERVWLVVGADTEPFDTFARAARDLGVDVSCIPEPEPLDTAGGVRSALDRVDGPFLVLNGDVLTDLDFTVPIQAHLRAGADATIVLTRVEDTSSFGVCVRDGSRITNFVEKPPPGTLPGQDAINAGTYVLEPAALTRFPEGPLSFETEVFPGILEAGGHIEGAVWEGVWADLGTPDRLRDATRRALAGELRWPSVTETADRGGGIRVAAEAEVAADATLVGPVLVLPGASIGAAEVGPDTVVGAGAEVADDATIRRSILFDDARVGPGVEADGLLAGSGATVEAGADLGKGVVIGDHEVVGAGEYLQDGERRPPAE